MRLVRCCTLFWILCVPGIGQHAVIVGIEQYPRSGPTPSLCCSTHDAALFYDFLVTKVPARNIAILTGQQAKLDYVKMALVTALGRAQPGEYVYLFISARAVANRGDPDGYLGTLDLVELKPESTGVPVSELRNMIDKSRAKVVFLFADVYRAPQTPNTDNRINSRLEDLAKLTNLVGILSTEKPRPSLEDENLLDAKSGRGFGVFGYELVKGMPGAATGSDLLSVLKQHVPSATGSYRQTPKDIGPAEVRRFPMWPTKAFHHLSDGPLVAALGIPGFLPLPQVAADAEKIVREVLGSGDPDTILANAKARQASLSTEDWEQVRDSTVAALASMGQDYITRYGVSDLLPEDPNRVRNENFAFAERAFQAALSLLPDEPIFHDYRRTLESRRRLCSGLKLIYQNQAASARTDLGVALAAVDRPIPEIENALGISYLEEGRDYESAIMHFRAAIERSPSWPYPRHNLALALAESGDSESAIQAYQAAIKATPDQPYLYYNLGLVLHRSNHKRDAEKTYNKTLAILSTAQTTYSARAAEWVTSLPEESKIAAARAIAFKNTEADVHNVLGALYDAERKYDRAEREYQAALGINPSFCEAGHNLGLLALKQAKGRRLDQKLKQARDLFQKNLEVCPAFPPTVKQLELLH